jgi:hypothetical protein
MVNISFVSVINKKRKEKEMAILKGNVMGNMSGKIGNLSARTVKGKTVLSARPSSFTPSRDPASIEVREKFAVTAKFASQVVNNPILAKIWKNSTTESHSVFNIVFQNNFEFSSTERPSQNNIITPAGFSVPVQSVVAGTDGVLVEINPLNSVILSSTEEVKLSVNSLICYYNPIDPRFDSFSFVSIADEIQNFDFSQPYEMNLPFDVEQKGVAAKYSNHIFYLSLVTKSSVDRIIRYSATFSEEH